MNFNGYERNNSYGTSGNSILNLDKGDILDLTKTAPSLKHVIIGAGWDVNESGRASYDLDLSAFLLDRNKRVTMERVKERVVYFKMMNQKGIYLEGDNLTGEGEGDDERIDVDLNGIAPDIEEIVFNVNIYDAKKKRQSFGMVHNSYIRLLDADDHERELARFNLNEDASGATAVTFAKLFRTGDGWSFEAVGDALVVDDLNELLTRYL